jgi:beta-glucosidase
MERSGAVEVNDAAIDGTAVSISGGVAASFPAGFLWGAATASYQVEGAAREDGRGESIWDRFCRVPGATLNGDTGDVACDAYHRFEEDVRLAAAIGLGAYRFSIAWPRVLPDGSGPVEERGLGYYDRLVDALLAAGIEPFVTLYHWDLPQALQDRGGWNGRDSALAFAGYADTLARRLGDRVRFWTTLNEPWVSAFVGHWEGRHAPGLRDLGVAVQASHNLLLAHGLAVQALRAALPPTGQVGITLNLSPVEPVDVDPRNAAAATRMDGYLNRWFLDPLAGRGYPADLIDQYGSRSPRVMPGDMEAISSPLDFLGINNYYRIVVRDDPAAPFPHVERIRPEGAVFSTMGSEINALGLERILRRVAADYAFPALYVTENGVALDDRLEPDGGVHDSGRVAYLADHIGAASRAVSAGAPLRGYFAWSMLDNFEWALGYSQRFGLVYVDYSTLRRYPKDSATWYGNFTRNHRRMASHGTAAAATPRP